MHDTWIDEHTGDELTARPAFEAELRAELARELGHPARPAERRTLWRAIGWATAAALAVVVTTVVVTGNDGDPKVTPGGTATITTPAPPATSAPPATETTHMAVTTPATPAAQPDSGGEPQIDWAAGTVLDLPLGFSSVDKVLTAVNPVYGEPTADSGWFTVEAIAPGDEDCLAGMEMRVLHWGDLTVAFRKAFTAEGNEGELLWSWVVGDLRGSGFDGFREPVAAPAGAPTRLRTEDGFGVGTSLDDLRGGEVVLSDFVNADGSRGGYFTPAGDTDPGSFRGIVVAADGTVIGFGTTRSDC